MFNSTSFVKKLEIIDFLEYKIHMFTLFFIHMLKVILLSHGN